MNIQNEIIELLKNSPGNRSYILKSFPETLPATVGRNLNALIMNQKLSFDGKVFSIAKKRNKHGNIKETIDGITFMSKLEAKRYTELKILEKAGEITDLKLQVPFVVSDAIEWDGEKLRAIKYVCDFMYHDVTGDKEVVEDAKGRALPLYILKRSLFLHRYPQYRFREIKK